MASFIEGFLNLTYSVDSVELEVDVKTLFLRISWSKFFIGSAHSRKVFLMLGLQKTLKLVNNDLLILFVQVTYKIFQSLKLIILMRSNRNLLN